MSTLELKLAVFNLIFGFYVKSCVYRCVDRSGSQGNDENPMDIIFKNLLFSNPFTGFVARAPDAVGPLLVTEPISHIKFKICLGQIFTYCKGLTADAADL